MAHEEFPNYPSLADAIEDAEKLTVRWGHNSVRHLSAAQVASIVAALRASGSESAPIPWIAISERRPESTSEVLVVTAGNRVSTRPGSWVHSLWEEIARGDDKYCAITHWAPMPNPPLERDGK